MSHVIPGNWNTRYDAISTAGTTTLDPGPGTTGNRSVSGVFYGAYLYALGTTPVLTAYDLIPPKGTDTATVTNTLLLATGTAAGQRFLAGLEGVGVRYRGALVIVTTGTATGWNALWD